MTAMHFKGIKKFNSEELSQLDDEVKNMSLHVFRITNNFYAKPDHLSLLK